MDAFALSIFLEVTIWLLYSCLTGCLILYVLRRRQRQRRERYVVSTSSSSGEPGGVELIPRDATSRASNSKNAREEEGGKEGRWKRKERLGSRRFLITTNRDSRETEEEEVEEEGDESQAPDAATHLNKQSVALSRRYVGSSPKNPPRLQQTPQSTHIPDNGIPYDKTDEDIPYVDDDVEDDDHVEDGVDTSTSPSSSSEVFASSTNSSTTNSSSAADAADVTTQKAPSLDSSLRNKSRNFFKKPRFPSFSACSQKHPRVKQNSTRFASVLLFLFIGYFLTVITAIIAYRSAEFLMLYSDAIQCRNVSYVSLAPDIGENDFISYNKGDDDLANSIDEKDAFTEDELENCLYYFNRSSGVTFEDVFIPVVVDGASNANIHAWWIPANSTGMFASSNLTLLYTHGNADNISFFKKLYKFMAVDLGVNVFTWDFPGYGKSGGDASEISIRTAAEDVMQYLQDKRGVNPEKLVLWGYSLGGSVAVELAHDYPKVKGVVMQAPIDSAADVVSSFLPLTGWSLAKILTQKYETKTRIRSLSTCLLQFVGDEDDMFTVSREKAMFGRAKRVNSRCKSFFTIPGLGHLDDPTENDIFRENIIRYFKIIH